MTQNIKCRLLITCCLLLTLCCLSDVFAQQTNETTSPEPSVQGNGDRDGSATRLYQQGNESDTVTSDSTGDPNAQKTVEMTDIHDIKPPEQIGYDLKWLYYLLSGILIAVLLAGLFLFFKHRKKKIKEQQMFMLPPDELALKMLDELLDIDTIDGKQFYFRLSAILRNYIHGRYNINAPEMTTEELIPKIGDFGLEKELHQKLRALLHSADPVKFAGIPAVQNKMQNDLLFVIDFVKKTKEMAKSEGDSTK